MNKVRASEEVAQLIAQIMAECDALKNKYADSDMPEEEVEKLKGMVAQLDSLDAEHEEAETRERLEKHRAKQNEPMRPAPKVPAQVRTKEEPYCAGEAFKLWLGDDRTPEANYRLRSMGITSGKTVNIPVDYGTLNRKQRKHQRAILSKGGSGTGADLVWQSYSSKVVEYLTYFSPILNYVASETTQDGNTRTYFTVDDTAMISTYTSASGGTEVAPTIPDTNLSTGSKDINCFDITSGYQKVSHNVLRDSYISLEDRIAKANSNSHARLLEKEILTATGDGASGVEGITSACTSAGTPSAWDQDVILTALTSIPLQYRNNVILVSNDTTRNEINVALRDEIGRSLFERRIEDDQEVDLLFGKKYIVSSYVAADTLLLFAPEFYQMRLVAGQQFQQFTERFWPNVAWAGLMSFGGAWLGPDSAAKKLVKGSAMSMMFDTGMASHDMLRENKKK